LTIAPDAAFTLGCDFTSGDALLLDRGGNRGGDFVDLVDNAADFGHCRHRVIGRDAHGVDLAANLAGGLGGLRGQGLHLADAFSKSSQTLDCKGGGL
jgi:hypothetical protein